MQGFWPPTDPLHTGAMVFMSEETLRTPYKPSVWQLFQRDYGAEGAWDTQVPLAFF